MQYEIGNGGPGTDSIAINGCDLTIVERTEDTLAFNAMPETYRRSNLGELRAGDPVNLERSVRPTDRLSGHIVRGVVEGKTGGALRDMALLNASATLLVADAVGSIEEGLVCAAESIESGQAAATLARLIELSNS